MLTLQDSASAGEILEWRTKKQAMYEHIAAQTKQPLENLVRDYRIELGESNITGLRRVLDPNVAMLAAAELTEKQMLQTRFPQAANNRSPYQSPQSGEKRGYGNTFSP